jgi:hypothetical protein
LLHPLLSLLLLPLLLRRLDLLRMLNLLYLVTLLAMRGSRRHTLCGAGDAQGDAPRLGLLRVGRIGNGHDPRPRGRPHRGRRVLLLLICKALPQRLLLLNLLQELERRGLLTPRGRVAVVTVVVLGALGPQLAHEELALVDAGETVCCIGRACSPSPCPLGRGVEKDAAPDAPMLSLRGWRRSGGDAEDRSW